MPPPTISDLQDSCGILEIGKIDGCSWTGPGPWDEFNSNFSFPFLGCCHNANLVRNTGVFKTSFVEW